MPAVTLSIVSTAQRGNRIQQTSWIQLDCLNFADDTALLSHTQWQMQENSTVVDNSSHLCLKVKRGQNKVLKNNTATSTIPTALDGDTLEEVTSFTYLGGIVIDRQGRTGADVKVRISRTRAAFLQMKNMWTSPNLTTNIKIRILDTTVKPVQLYGAETWRTTAATLNKIHTFVNTWLRQILRIWWPETISNRELWTWSIQQPAEGEIPGDGMNTPSKTQWPVPHIKPWPGTHRERESKATRETPGSRIRRLKQRGWLHMVTA